MIEPIPPQGGLKEKTSYPPPQGEIIQIYTSLTFYSKLHFMQVHLHLIRTGGAVLDKLFTLAFSKEMQVLLFFVNFLVSLLSYYWGACLVLTVFKREEIGFRRKVLFSMLCVLLDRGIVYGASFINGAITHRGTLYIGNFRYAFENMLPFGYFVLCCAGIKILHLTSHQSVFIMKFSYIYFFCCNLSSKFYSRFFVKVLQTDTSNWDYFADIQKIVGGTVIVYINYRIFKHYLKKTEYGFAIPDNPTTKSTSNLLVRNFIECALLYALVTAVYYMPDFDAVYAFLLLAFMLTYLILSINLEFNRFQKQWLLNSNEHISILISAVESFREIKHDFNNILQTYGGFLSVGAYDELKEYHLTVAGTVLDVEGQMQIGKRFTENPSFFALLLSKMEYAKSKQVTLDTRYLCNLTSIPMDQIDFNRVMSNLLDNAIEAAAQTTRKAVGLAARETQDNSLLFIVSNDASDAVPIHKIFMPAFTTKAGHQGYGLTSLQAILSKYGNVTFHVTSYRNRFIVYLELLLR